MKLFYWTYHDYDSCSHHAAFAETEREALDMVFVQMGVDWPVEKYISHISQDAEALQEYIQYRERRLKEKAGDFVTDPKWVLNVYEVTPGGLQI